MIHFNMWSWFNTGSQYSAIDLLDFNKKYQFQPTSTNLNYFHPFFNSHFPMKRTGPKWQTGIYVDSNLIFIILPLNWCDGNFNYSVHVDISSWKEMRIFLMFWFFSQCDQIMCSLLMRIPHFLVSNLTFRVCSFPW